MLTFLNFTPTGDPTFDLFFSLPASLSILYFTGFAFTAFFRGRV